MKNLLNVLVELVRWEDLGAHLGLKHYKLTEIDRNKRGDVGQCKLALVDMWLRTDVNASWEKLVQALRDMGGAETEGETEGEDGYYARIIEKIRRFQGASTGPGILRLLMCACGLYDVISFVWL